MNNQTQLDAIKAKIEEMKAKKNANIEVKTVNLDEIKKDIHVAVSDSQIKMYTKLCVEKRVQMNPLYRSFDGRKGGAMDKAIQELIKLPTIKAPSEGQITMLQDLCLRNEWTIPEYHHLTGGRDGSFSKMLGELMNLEKELRSVQPPTEKQIETILNMYFCPDVDMSDLHEDYAVKYSQASSTGKVIWTRPSQETVAETVASLVTYQEASAFIYKFQLEFYKWTNTRCTAGQMDKMRRLQEQCKMQPMEDYQLMQFDKEGADRYINNMNMVRRDADLVKFPQEALVEDIDRCNTQIKAIEKDRETKDNILYSLYAMMGMSGSEESGEGIDLSNNDDVIADLALVCIGICGSKNVLELLATAYTDEEMGILLERMYPKNENTMDIDNMSIEELEAYMASIEV